MRAHMRRISPLRNNSCVGPDGAVCVKLMGTIGLVIGFALATVETRIRLSSYANSLAGLDKCHLWAYSNGSADNFYAFVSTFEAG